MALNVAHQRTKLLEADKTLTEIDEQVPYWQQYNKQHYTQDAIETRLGIRFSNVFLHVQAKWLKTLPSPITKRVYFELSESLSYKCTPEVSSTVNIWTACV